MEEKPYYKNFVYDVLDLMFLIARNNPDVEKYKKELTFGDEKCVFRPVSPTDDEAVLDLYKSLSKETVYFRFFLTKKSVPKSRIRKYTRIDYEKNFALVAEKDEKLIGIGRYIVDKSDPTAAEMSIVIGDGFQRRGIGTTLIRYLIWIAKNRGVKTIYATILPDNYKVLNTIKKLGFKFKKQLEDGDIRVEADITNTPDEWSLS